MVFPQNRTEKMSSIQSAKMHGKQNFFAVQHFAVFRRCNISAQHFSQDCQLPLPAIPGHAPRGGWVQIPHPTPSRRNYFFLSKEFNQYCVFFNRTDRRDLFLQHHVFNSSVFFGCHCNYIFRLWMLPFWRKQNTFIFP
jgi:hypothetical protein